MRTRSSPSNMSQYSQASMQSTQPGPQYAQLQHPHQPPNPSQLSQTSYLAQQQQQPGMMYAPGQDYQKQAQYMGVQASQQYQQQQQMAHQHPATRQHIQHGLPVDLQRQAQGPNGFMGGGIMATLPNVVVTPISTPSNNPAGFQSPFYQQPQINDASLTIEKRLLEQKSSGATFGFGAGGVNILTRVLMSLQCGIETEEQWALGALVEMSCSPTPFWTFNDNDILTTTLLKRLKTKSYTDEAQDKKTDAIFEFDKNTVSQENLIKQQRDLELLLTLRNMAVAPENAKYLAKLPLCKDIIAYGLDITNYGVNEEYLHYCIELLEMTSIFMKCDSFQDTLFQNLVRLVSDGDDRSILVPALRSMSRLLIQDEINICKSFSTAFISQILRYLLTTDYELIAASLDFLYQYTAHPENISKLMTDATDTAAARAHLIRLLTFGMNSAATAAPEYRKLPKRVPDPVPEEAPELKPDVVAELMTYSEPDRAALWIRSCYEPNPRSEVTQISLWKTYEAQFEPHARAGGTRLLPAVEFIRNVAAAFHNSQAVVSALPNGQKKFVVKGIQPRRFAIAPSKLKEKEAGGSSDTKNGPASSAKQPPVFGATVALVLQNIARSDDGKRMLRPVIGDLIAASLKNANVAGYIGDLLVILDDNEDDDGSEANKP